MAIDWRRIVTDNRIPYIERGPNVKRGELNIKCPMCGSADPSFHMGLNLETGWWACWRNKKAHSGKSPLRLLMALLHVPYWKAREIAGLMPDYVDPEGFTAVAARLLGRITAESLQEKPDRRFLQWPRDATLIGSQARTRRHLDYLARRGFDLFAADLCLCYGLHAAGNEWQDRVLVPYQIDGELVTWTGRAIADARIRYRDLSVDDSVVPPKETLLNYDCIAQGGRCLIICEGPVDALKLDFFGYGVGVRAVALSTNTIGDEQLYMLEEARGQFDWVGVMMDATPGGMTDSLEMRGQLEHLDMPLRSVQVPYGCKDAGELSAEQALDFTTRLGKEDQ